METWDAITPALAADGARRLGRVCHKPRLPGYVCPKPH